jgi:hypothetical protein
VAGAVLVLACLWLYQAQTSGMATRWRVVLPLLRQSALLLLLLSMLKPALLRVRAADQQAAVLLMVDRSESMGVADVELPPAQQVALADSLGILPAGSRERVGQRLRELLDAAVPQLSETSRLIADLEYARLSGRNEQPARQRLDESLVLVTNTASQFRPAAEATALEPTLKNDLAELAKWPAPDTLSQWARKSTDVVAKARRRVAELQADADRLWYNRDDVIRQLCQRMTAEPRLRLAERALTAEQVGLLDRLGDTPLYGFSFAGAPLPLPLRAGLRPVRQFDLRADGEATDITGAAASAIESLRGRDVQAIVVLSDGRPTRTSRLPAALRGIPIFPVLIGGEHSVRDLSLEPLEVPQSPFVGETMLVKARLRRQNLPAGDVQLTLRTAGSEQVRQVTWGTGPLAEVEFSVKLTTPGVQELSVTASELPGEASTANNTARRLLKVHADKVRVAAMCGFASWDYQYLSSALARAPWARLEERIIEPGATLQLPDLGSHDVFILFNVPPAAISEAQARELHDAVTQRGAAVLLSVQDPAMLAEYERRPLLADLLPYRPGGNVAWRTWPGETPAFHIAPPLQHTNEPLLRLADDPEQSRAVWEELPAAYHLLALPALKPNLLRTLLEERDSRASALLESRLGLGRIFFYAFDESWRWRQTLPEAAQDRLWAQIVRYGTEPPYAARGGALSLDLDHVTVAPGTPARARLRVDPQLLPAGALPRLVVYSGSSQLREEHLLPHEHYGAGRFQAAIHDLPPGSYRVEASLPQVSGQPAVSLPLRVGDDLATEVANFSAQPDFLRQLASSSGGEMVALDHLADLPRMLARLRDRSVQTVEIRLWDNWPLFLAVLSLLTAEWALRKRAGLP